MTSTSRALAALARATAVLPPSGRPLASQQGYSTW
jgi:hypothetical protein